MSDVVMVEAFWDALLALAAADGVAPLKARPGLWERRLDARWWLAVNPHRAPNGCSHGPVVEPFEVYVEYQGWPWGRFDATGGECGDGDAANVTTFLAALREAAR